VNDDSVAEAALTVTAVTVATTDVEIEITTFLIFLDLPSHFEFRVSKMPVVPLGTIIHFKLRLRNPKDPKRLRKIDGPYSLVRKKLVYSNEISNRTGLSQYLEFSPAQDVNIHK
jgi:hypothetical protein